MFEASRLLNDGGGGVGLAWRVQELDAEGEVLRFRRRRDQLLVGCRCCWCLCCFAATAATVVSAAASVGGGCGGGRSRVGLVCSGT